MLNHALRDRALSFMRNHAYAANAAAKYIRSVCQSQFCTLASFAPNPIEVSIQTFSIRPCLLRIQRRRALPPL